MKTKESGAGYSAIVGIGERIGKISKETGQDFLLLNRGVNAVCNIDLNRVAKEIDFNTPQMQVYPPSRGHNQLRMAINKVYFHGESSVDSLSVCGGGMSALDLVFQTLEVDCIYLPFYYWGSYHQIATVRNKNTMVYPTLEDLESNTQKYRGSAVVICDPNNPIGNKVDDAQLIRTIKVLSDNDVVVIVDCPYRRIFCSDEDTFFRDLLKFRNVIIVESFSKSVGLSGQRLGFVHSKDEQFNKELGIRLMYATNGINAFSQILVTHLLTTETGKVVVDNFKRVTVAGIRKNIKYLRGKGFLAEEFYDESDPVGIFVIVNKSQQELLDKRIGSVALSYFTPTNKEYAQQYARVCVSVPHENMVRFFDQF